MNTITHIEIPAPDLEKAIRFYSSIFSWRIEIMKEDRYAYFIIEEGKSGGGLDTSLKPAQENCGAQIVVDVEDIEVTLDKIVAAGGSMTIPKTAIEGGHGYYAGFRDPNGNYLQIHSRK
jgi:predicted enzyme related to lactoylglutathione lyase